jgi:TolB protein
MPTAYPRWSGPQQKLRDPEWRFHFRVGSVLPAHRGKTAVLFPTRLTLWTLGILLLCGPSHAEAPAGAISAAPPEVSLEVREAGFRTIDLVLGEFVCHGKPKDVRGLERQVAGILRNDLELSAYFNVIDGGELGDLWEETSAVDRWSALGAQALVEGKVEVRKDRISLQAFLSDLTTAQLVARKKYEGTREELRGMLHSLSDEIVHKLTGDQGIATCRMVFVSDRTGNKELYVSDYDGFNVHQLTSNGSINRAPACSPDGRWLVYTSYRRGNPDQFLFDLKETKERLFCAFPGLNSGASWDRDGDRLALTLSRDGNAELYQVKSDGSDLRRLTRSPAIDCSPCWSPNGRQVVFTSDRAGSPQIYVLDVGDLSVSRLVRVGQYCDSPVWSPKGDLIAFAAREGGFFDLWLVDPTGGKLRRLTYKGESNEDPSWAPNGQHLAYTSWRNAKADIHLAHVRGGVDYRLPAGPGNNTEPDWLP